jgi:hypothetical protein
MFFSGRDQDDVTWSDLLDRAAPPLHATTAGSNDQRLSERMRVPRRTRAWLERDARAGGARRITAIEEWIHADPSSEVGFRRYRGGLRAGTLDFHCRFLSIGITK